MPSYVNSVSDSSGELWQDGEGGGIIFFSLKCYRRKLEKLSSVCSFLELFFQQ